MHATVSAVSSITFSRCGVVDELEEKYADFPGLNLTFETREGILKHCSKKNARTVGEIGERFLDRGQPGLEAQLANIADEIAYNNHDVDDGLRAGLLNEEELDAVDLFRDTHEFVREKYPGRRPPGPDPGDGAQDDRHGRNRPGRAFAQRARGGTTGGHRRRAGIAAAVGHAQRTDRHSPPRAEEISRQQPVPARAGAGEFRPGARYD